MFLHAWRNVGVRGFGFGLLLLALVLPAAQGQSAGKTIRVGVVFSGSAKQFGYLEAGLVAGLRDHGYVEGKNLVLERRFGELQPERIKRSAAELADMNLDAIVTSCTATTRIVMDAAGGTPIVMAGLADPVGQGLARSLARPGSHITGRSGQLDDLEPKKLELLRSVLPEGARVAVLVNTGNPVHEAQWQRNETVARSLNLKLVRIEVGAPAELEKALDRLAKVQVRGLLLLADDPIMVEFRGRIAAVAAGLRVVSVSGFRAFADEGGLMSYGSGATAEAFRLTAAHVVKIASGAKPAELPIELPTQIQLVINLKTAAAIGVTVPRELLLRADEIIR